MLSATHRAGQACIRGSVRCTFIGILLMHSRRCHFVRSAPTHPACHHNGRCQSCHSRCRFWRLTHQLASALHDVDHGHCSNPPFDYGQSIRRPCDVLLEISYLSLRYFASGQDRSSRLIVSPSLGPHAPSAPCSLRPSVERLGYFSSHPAC